VKGVAESVAMLFPLSLLNFTLAVEALALAVKVYLTFCVKATPPTNAPPL